VPQLVLQVALRPVLEFADRPNEPGSAYVSALSFEQRLLRLRHRCLIQVRGLFAHQPAFGLRWRRRLTERFGLPLEALFDRFEWGCILNYLYETTLAVEVEGSSQLSVKLYGRAVEDAEH